MPVNIHLVPVSHIAVTRVGIIYSGGGLAADTAPLAVGHQAPDHCPLWSGATFSRMVGMHLVGGEQVLICATVSADGRTVMVAPGVELRADAVDIRAELPPIAYDMQHGVILLFECPDDLREFINTYQSEEI